MIKAIATHRVALCGFDDRGERFALVLELRADLAWERLARTRLWKRLAKAGATTWLTEDLQHRMNSDGVVVEHPFADA